jgi:hypothetical protein
MIKLGGQHTFSEGLVVVESVFKRACQQVVAMKKFRVDVVMLY